MPHGRSQWSPKKVLYFVLLWSSVFATIDAQQYSYTRDCFDQHHTEVKCFVELVDCDGDSWLPNRTDNNNLKVPDEAHDIRVESFAKTVLRRQIETYQLSVDISLQTPPNNSTKFLQGFLLQIESEDQRTRLCFFLNVSGSNWTELVVSESPRLHLLTENLFNFAQKYEISVYSLPESNQVEKVVRTAAIMPQNPRGNSGANSFLSLNCTQYSNPFASKWTAGFRRIILHPIARTIQIEFVGAPSQYCFEQYEVRLLDETGLELLHSDIISVDQMTSEKIDNNTILFGQYNFTNLDLDKNYIPSVIAVERATDGRCLCPVYGTNPYDNTVVCSCIAADWRAVKLQKVSENGYAMPSNKSISSLPIETDHTKSWNWSIYSILSVSVLGILICVIFLLVSAYRHYEARGKAVRIRFIQDRSKDQPNSLTPRHDGQTKALLENTAQSTTIVMTNTESLNLLIVYAHDSPEHDAAVVAFADFLRDVFTFDVHLDVYDVEKTERNLMDYLSSSIIDADKILVVNSMGTAQRYQNKIRSVPGSCSLVERTEATPFDSLFIQQIDMVLQHHGVVSVRFDYSQFNEVLFPLHGTLQYVLPNNLIPLVSALTSTNLKNDARLTNSHPTLQRMTAAVEAQKERINNDPNWFVRTHHRRQMTSRQFNADLTSVLPNMPTIPTIPAGDIEEEQFVGIPFAFGEATNDRTSLSTEDQLPDNSYAEEVKSDQTEFSIVHDVPTCSVPDQHSNPVDSGIHDDTNASTRTQSISEEQTDEEKVDEADKKWRPKEPLDSGVISEADFQMISSAT